MRKAVCHLVLIFIVLLQGYRHSGNPVEHVSLSHASAPPEIKTLFFSGYAWTVKAALDSPVGPGPNYFAPDNVWVDKKGRLHLRIDYQGGRWRAAEVISKRSFGFGTYRFYLGNVDELDPHAVLGLFTWHDDPAYTHREIDIEIARWGKQNNDNVQCVVQPWSRPGNLVRFALPQGLQTSLHSFTWKPGHVFCQVREGSDPHRGRSGAVIFSHTFTAGIPQAGGENARINLWLFGGHAPQDRQAIEVVIRKFEFQQRYS